MPGCSGRVCLRAVISYGVGTPLVPPVRIAVSGVLIGLNSSATCKNLKPMLVVRALPLVDAEAQLRQTYLSSGASLAR